RPHQRRPAARHRPRHHLRQRLDVRTQGRPGAGRGRGPRGKRRARSGPGPGRPAALLDRREGAGNRTRGREHAAAGHSRRGRGHLEAFDRVPYYRVVSNEVPENLFRDKIVLIGPTSEVLHDVFATAFAGGGDMPGVVIHANALETFIHGDPIREVPRLASTILAVLAALVGSMLVVRLRAVRALAVTGLLLALGVAVAFAVFALADVWMRGVAITFGLVLGYGATVVENFVREQREKQRLSRFFSPDVLRAVVRDRDGRSLHPRRRLVTVLFSDIRGFTTISERLEPEQVDE